jgi:2-polyprenyl-3-methyl-5-hydroxy-6-metoxy-1,4-benzoquinol methylase
MHDKAGLESHTTYYRNVRLEMLPFVPTTSRRVLELGCAEGAFAIMMKQRMSAEVWGIESNARAAARAGAALDRVLVGDADARIVELPDAYFDAVICNDVLEHLVDPTVTLALLRRKLTAGGVVVASIPNIRYFPALRTLIFQADFPQDDDGIFDRTHLRFFTRKSIVRMFTTAGFTVQRIEGITARRRFLGVVLAVLSFGFFTDGFYLQYACVASPEKGSTV